MGFWSKVKGLFGRVGRGIKNVATKAYDWISGNRDKIQKGIDTFNDITKGKYTDYTNKGTGYLDKGMDIARRLGIQ